MLAPQEAQKLWRTQRDKLNAEIDALRSLLEAESKKTHAALQATAMWKYRSELLCKTIHDLCGLAEAGVDHATAPQRAQELVDTARRFAEELLKESW